MNKMKITALIMGALVLGLLVSKAGLLPLVAVITAVVAVAVLFLDYEKATLIVALYTVFEFLLRTVLARPLSQILSLFGRRAYFEFVTGSSPMILSSYWDELALLLCFGIWFYKWLRYHKEKPYRATPLDISIILFMLLGVILLFAAAPDFLIGVEGLRVVIQYMLWFFVVTQLLRTPEGAKRILNIVLLTGFLISLHGIYQYIIAVDIPAGWLDEMEGTVRTRVFSIFTSCNMMAGFLATLIPISVGLFFAEKNRTRKIYYGIAFCTMWLSLLFTMSRAGWVFCFAALVVFVWLKNKKMVLPALLAMAALFIFAIIFVPSVANRILYVISPQYVVSSMSGGRFFRAAESFPLFIDNIWTGMGLGQFGGSVAISHKLNDTFSMDNYYLKTAVEMGIFGIAAFMILMYNTFTWCSRAISKIRDKEQKDWVRGIVSSIVVVILYNLTENMLEIPLIASYFWMFAGIVMFLAYGSKRLEREAPQDSATLTEETG